MNKDKVLDLAKLARVKISDTEAESLSHEFDAILQYVGEVKSISTHNPQPTPNNFPIRNVMREDVVGHEPGTYTEILLAAAPTREGDYVKVKKIL